MGSIIFVHGTGVRRTDYDETFNLIENALPAELSGWKLSRCCWGELHDDGLHDQRASIPIEGKDEELEVWAVLYNDPLYELRLVAMAGGEGEKFVPGRAPILQRLLEELEQFQPSDEFAALLDQRGLSDAWRKALTEITSDDVFAEAIPQAGSFDREIAEIIGRAVMAQTTINAPLPAIPGVERDRIIERFVNETSAGEEKGVGQLLARIRDSIKGHIKKATTYATRNALTLASVSATSYSRNRRVEFSDMATPAVGDILRYQTRGEAIRDFIQTQITAAPGPAILLAHSLGGIACVDLLVMENIPKVIGLITVGSQAPLLYEMNSLYSLCFGQPLPGHFPKQWLNFYDPNDFLSYVGGRVFPGRVTDYKINSGQPFWPSHSAYWSAPEFWPKVANFASECMELWKMSNGQTSRDGTDE